MSSRIGLCPSCGLVGQHVDLEPDAIEFLKLAVLHRRLNFAAWDVRGAWCVKCEMPYLVVWPENMPAADRTEFLADVHAVLQIKEKGGR